MLRENMVTTSAERRNELALRTVLLILASGWVCFADDTPPEKPAAREAAAAPLERPDVTAGQFVTISGPVDDAVLARVQNAALRLQSDAAGSERPPVLVLHIEPAASPVHQALALAKFLASGKSAPVKTVAWIPSPLQGTQAAIALACQEIVLHPEAGLGDIDRSRSLDDDDKSAILEIVQKRNQPKLPLSLVRAMLNPQDEVWNVRLDDAQTRIVSRDELQALRDAGRSIDRADVVKAAGDRGLFSAAVLRDLGLVATHTASTRIEVAELYKLSREALRERIDGLDRRTTQRIVVKGDVSPMMESFAERQIDRAVASGVKLLIFEIESPGGFTHSGLTLAARIADLSDRKIRTVAYIPKRALSAAAFIAFGCDEICMLPEASIGDAGTMEIGKGGQFERVPEKIVSHIKAELRTLAERKNRPPALLEAMVDRKLIVYRATNRQTGREWFVSEAEITESPELWERGPPVRETDGELLLTVNGTRAHELRLAEPPVEDWEELVSRLGLPPGEVVPLAEQNWVDRTVFVLNLSGVTVLLLLIGIACMYLEIHFFTGILGILAVTCFGLFFWSKMLGGTAGGLEVVLFLIGAACLAMEILVIPGFGVFGVSGILLLLVSLIMAGTHWGAGLNMDMTVASAGRMAGQLAAVGTGIIVLIAVLGRVLPNTPMFDRLVLTPPDYSATHGREEPRLRRDLAAGPTPAAPLQIGAVGVAQTMLRPAGKIRVGSDLYDAESDGQFISPETPVEVIDIVEKRIVVAPRRSITA